MEAVGKRLIIDIGELGWSLYLSAHALWLKRAGCGVCVITYKERFPLYGDRAHRVIEVPQSFTEQFGRFPQDGAGLRGVEKERVQGFFNQFIPNGYRLDYGLGCDWGLSKKMSFAPYEPSISASARWGKTPKRILVFPRCRSEAGFSFRNLSKEFYISLLMMLCKEFPDNLITIVGSFKGAYSFEDFSASNFENLIGKTDMQDVIDLCSVSRAAIGGTSAPPKISLLQGTPTFIIGHEKKRFTETDNWLKTDAGFYEIKVTEYQDFDIYECLQKIKGFVDAH